MIEIKVLIENHEDNPIDITIDNNGYVSTSNNDFLDDENSWFSLAAEHRAFTLFFRMLNHTIRIKKGLQPITDDDILDCVYEKTTTFHTPNRFDLNKGGGGYYDTNEVSIALPKLTLEITRS
jgi:hypothetical protein